MKKLQKVSLRLATLAEGGTNSSTIFFGKYWDKTDQRHLCMNMAREVFWAENPPDGSPVFRKEFSQKDPDLVFEWDPNNPDHPGSKVRAFLLYHNMVKSESFENRNLISPVFVMEDFYSKNIQAYNYTMNVGKIIEVVRVLGYNELVNICFAFNGNPIGLTKRELIIDLIEPSSGRLFSQENMQLFFNEYAIKSEAIMMKANINRAIAAGIITKKSQLYYLNTTPLGDNIDSIMNFFLTHSDIYEGQIKNAMAFRGTFKDDDNLDEVPDTIVVPMNQSEGDKTGKPGGSGAKTEKQAPGSKTTETDQNKVTKDIENVKEQIFKLEEAKKKVESDDKRSDSAKKAAIDKIDDSISKAKAKLEELEKSAVPATQE